MIIDFHTHIFPDEIASACIKKLARIADIPPYTDGTKQGILDAMDKAGIDMAVALPVVTKAPQFHTIMNFAQEINETYSGKLLSFGGVHPESDNYRRDLRMIRDLGIPGVKIHPDYQKVMIDDIRYMRIIDYATELGLIIVTHAGVDVGLPERVHCPPKKMRSVLDQLKPDKMVVAHYGGWGQWEEVYEYLAGEDVYLDTALSLAHISKELFVKILRKHGADKILFATDSPWSGMEEDIQTLKNMGLEPEEEEAIFSGNAKKLLGME